MAQNMLVCTALEEDPSSALAPMSGGSGPPVTPAPGGADTSVHK